MEPILRIYTLGGLRTSIGDNAPLRFSASRAELLICYLAMHPHEHGREALAHFLWDDRPHAQALTNLRSLLAQLPKEIKPYLQTTRQTIGIHPDQPVWVDALQLQPPLTAERLALHNGPFLSGIFVSDSRGLEDWMLLTRERLQFQVLNARQRLAVEALHQRRYLDGIVHAQEALKIDPFHEGVVRLLMRLLSRSDQRNAAVMQYRALAKLLDEEMGVEPADETIDLYDRLRTAPAYAPHELPTQPTPFIGRAAERTQLQQLLDEADGRIVTLIGLGGMGKTRLAVQVADERRGDYLQGVFFVPLAEIVDGTQLLQHILHTLGVPLQPGPPAAVQLEAYLAPREMLLILDNIEHLLDDNQPTRQILSTLVEATPHLTLLITSREPLHLPQEQVMRLRGLTDEALTLFELCSQRTRPGFELTDAMRPSAEKLCQLLDGLPLAIELAAAALMRLPLPQIVTSIEENLDILSTKMRDVPQRHRSLQATFESSWKLLEVDEQQTLARLAVFVGSFTTAAAVTITATSAVQLQELQHKSLLQPVTKGRWQLVAMLRQFAYGKWVAQGDVQTITADHGRYYLSLLAEQAADLQTAALPEAVRHINEGLANAQAGWQWGLATQQLKLLMAATHGWGLFFDNQGRYVEGGEFFTAAVEQIRTWVAPSKLLLGQLLGWQGYFFDRSHAPDTVEGILQESVELLEDHPYQQAFPLLHLGSAAYGRGHYDKAQRYLEQARAQFTAAQNIWGLVQVLNGLGYIAIDRGQIPEAGQLFEQSLQLAQQSGNPRQTAIIFSQLGRITERHGRLEEALSYYQEALQLSKLFDDKNGIIYLRNLIGGIHRQHGRLAEARTDYQKGLALAQESGDVWSQALFSVRLGNVAEAMTEYELASELYQQGLQICERINDQRGVAIALHHAAAVSFALGKNDLACQQIMQALSTAVELRFTPVVLNGLLNWLTIAAEQSAADLRLTVASFVYHHPAADGGQQETASAAMQHLRNMVQSEADTAITTGKTIAHANNGLQNILSHLQA